MRAVFDAEDEELLFEEPAPLEPVSAPAMPSPWGPANANPVTTAAAPIRAVSLAAKRFFCEDPGFDMLPPA
ncbi:hypothetical protein MHEL_32880 [Mycolicibacterium helvum]|uniref:Uncharacterized protein n=1 Tax=Mycolicibacterium helvum TaxID=1534349 RepID=A0A7I7T9Q0_9MYCO|nr:hypothetical protein [Mycolicibacterium helvum]BBY65045.1 hypothetical protein MHEL_32880 [Mycolicibacterium helvum]